MSKIKELLNTQLDRDSGAKLQLDDCSIHGKDIISLILYNQGGHDATVTCIKCIEYLTSLLSNNDEVIDFTEEIKKEKLYSRYNNTKPQETARDNLINKLLSEFK